MTTTGVADFNPDLVEIIEEAFERVGSEARTGYDFRTARRSLNLLFADWANRGLNLWTIEQGSILLEQGVDTYLLPPDTVDLMETVVRTGVGTAQTDLAINRISVSTYATLPSKNTQGRPIQMLVERQINPRVKLWPVPDKDAEYTLVYWRLRRIQNAGDGVNTADIPFRFVPCMIAGLAYYLAMKVPGGLERIQLLQQQYEVAWQNAADEDREKASVSFTPQIGYI
jgi:hypothetical protein